MPGMRGLLHRDRRGGAIVSASARVIEALLTSTRPVPAWTREDYEAVCEHCGMTMPTETPS